MSPLLFLSGIAPMEAAAQAAPEGPLSTRALKDGAYRIMIFQQTVKLKNGLYEPVKPSQKALLSGKYLRVEMGPAALGDLTGDGREEAAVILRSSGGGSGVFYEVAAVVNKEGRPVHQASAELGDRVKIHHLAIQSGMIVIDLTTHGPDDPACCPTVRKVVRYRLAGNKLEPR